MNEFQEDLLAFNRRMKKAGRHSERMNMDQYINWRFGKTSIKKSNSTYKSSGVYRRSNLSYIKSLDTGAGVASKPSKKEYTGTLIKGIATMHKSNAVPIINQEQATEISRMERGG
jgi:hypothetical protein